MVLAKSSPTPAGLLLLSSLVEVVAAMAEVHHLYIPTAPAVTGSFQAFLQYKQMLSIQTT